VIRPISAGDDAPYVRATTIWTSQRSALKNLRGIIGTLSRHSRTRRSARGGDAEDALDPALVDLNLGFAFDEDDDEADEEVEEAEEEHDDAAAAVVDATTLDRNESRASGPMRLLAVRAWLAASLARLAGGISVRKVSLVMTATWMLAPGARSTAAPRSDPRVEAKMAVRREVSRVQRRSTAMVCRSMARERERERERTRERGRRRRADAGSKGN
jgi:hypothetical protein